MKDTPWDDLQIFFHVAESGGLSGAARALGLSPPTVGRRMLALEQTTGQALFERSQTGYGLTFAGQSLLKRVRAMQAAALPVQEFLSPDAKGATIRITAGTATAMFLASSYHRLCRPGDHFRVNFLTTEAVMDIAHREADLGIRNRPAEGGNLASRKMQMLRFAPYRAYGTSQPDLMEWVALDPSHARHPAGRWLHSRPDLPVCALANSVATVHELVRAGVGIGVMPCMSGDRDPALVRAGPIIEELTETQWLVMHADDRHLPHMRRAIDRIVDVFHENADLLAGLRPLRGSP